MNKVCVDTSRSGRYVGAAATTYQRIWAQSQMHRFLPKRRVREFLLCFFKKKKKNVAKKNGLKVTVVFRGVC